MSQYLENCHENTKFFKNVWTNKASVGLDLKADVDFAEILITKYSYVLDPIKPNQSVAHTKHRHSPEIAQKTKPQRFGKGLNHFPERCH